MKHIYPIGLFLAVCSASLFMILESGEYYSTFYQNNYQGYWAASLVEVFLAMCAVLSFKKKPVLNWAIKFSMVPLFIAVVAGASLKVVSPMVKKLSEIDSNNKLSDFLVQENQQNKKNLVLLEGQKTNTALALKHQRKIANQLIEVFDKQTTKSWMIWVEIGFTTFLRFSVQIANLVFAHCLGVLLRGGKIQVSGRRKYKKRIKKGEVLIGKELKVV